MTVEYLFAQLSQSSYDKMLRDERVDIIMELFFSIERVYELFSQLFISEFYNFFIEWCFNTPNKIYSKPQNGQISVVDSA